MSLYTDYKVTYIDIYLQYNKRCIQIQKNICNFVTFSLLVSNTNASRRYKKVTKLQISSPNALEVLFGAILWLQKSATKCANSRIGCRI